MFARINQAILMRHAAYRAAREEGQTMAEYGLLLALIALGVIVAAGFLGDDISALFDDVGDEVVVPAP